MRALLREIQAAKAPMPSSLASVILAAESLTTEHLRVDTAGREAESRCFRLRDAVDSAVKVLGSPNADVEKVMTALERVQRETKTY